MTAQTERLNIALDGRYRILRHLGEGGMATVYPERSAVHAVCADDLRCCHRHRTGVRAATVGGRRELDGGTQTETGSAEVTSAVDRLAAAPA